MATPQRLSDRYELGEILGLGGMSEVHLARDVRLHRDVAVKVLRADLARDPTFYLRFRRVIQRAAALNHPAIVAVHDSGEAETPDGRVPYIVMEYVDGVTLRDIVDDGPIEPQRAIEIVADACQALNYSHQHRIIHRDVKPANIMITKAGAVKVMDFGIARAMHDDGIRLTQTSAVIGTAQYLSPEQANGDTVDARSDVYSLGCVFYELLTGEPPFVGESPVSVAYQHVRRDPAPPSNRKTDLSAELDAVVLKALAKNPDNRYQSAAEMRTDLIRVHGGEEPHAPKVFTDADRSDLMSSPLLRRDLGPLAGSRWRRWLTALASLVVLAVAVTVAVNVVVGDRQHVPDVSGQAQGDAQVSLQNLGFKTVINPEANSTVKRGLVIGTDPAADTNARLDDTITINVSSGPEQRKVPYVSYLSPSDATKRLKEAGFDLTVQTNAASPTVPKGMVVNTSPPADTSSTVTDRITIFVSSGPGTRPLPDVTTQTADLAKSNLNIVGFTTILTAPVDSTLPSGQVATTDPPFGTDLPLDAAITLKVSNGNQFSMPDLTGYFYVDLEQLLRQNYGFIGQLLKGADIPAGDQNRNKVVQQTPPASTGVNRDGTITLNYGS